MAAISQSTLSPIKILYKGRFYYAFDSTQTRYLLYKLEQSKIRAGIAISEDSTIKVQDRKISVQDSIINNQRNIININDRVVFNKDSIIDLQKDNFKLVNDALKKEKASSRFWKPIGIAGVSLAVLFGIIAYIK